MHLYTISLIWIYESILLAELEIISQIRLNLINHPPPILCIYSKNTYFNLIIHNKRNARIKIGVLKAIVSHLNLMWIVNHLPWGIEGILLQRSLNWLNLSFTLSIFEHLFKYEFIWKYYSRYHNFTYTSCHNKSLFRGDLKSCINHEQRGKYMENERSLYFFLVFWKL